MSYEITDSLKGDSVHNVIKENFKVSHYIIAYNVSF